MKEFKSIAIDGPAASGKTSVGLLLAKRLNFVFLDTGVMYRAVTWAALEKGIDIYDEKKISDLAGNLEIKITLPSYQDSRKYDIFVDDIDISWKINNQKVSEFVSQVSTYRGVREILTNAQRKIAEGVNIVMVGRDIGTVVLPDADWKFFLVASIEERAKRRYEELIKRGEQADFDEIISNVSNRDEIDSNRKHAPLKSASDSVIVDTNNKSVDQVVDELTNIICK